MIEEKKSYKKIKKILFRISVTIVIFIAVVIVFISPITKYLVQKYDVKYLGREVTMDWAYVNPFTGYIHFDDLKIFENKSDSVFFSASGVSANFAMLKMLSKTYEISSITIDKSKGTILRTNSVFNFNDIVLKFSDKDTLKPKKEKPPVHFNILNIAINNSEFSFKETNSSVNYLVTNVNFKSDGKYWDRDSINGDLSLVSGIKNGFLKLKFSINTKSLDYNFAALLKDFNLNVSKQYLKEMANYGNLTGNLNADVKATGNLKNKKDIDGKGYLIINDLHFGKDSLNDFVAFKKLTLAFKQIAPASKKYLIDSVTLLNPVFKYEKYDYLDNVQNMFGAKGSKVKAVTSDPEKFNLVITITRYVRNIFENFLESDYKVKRLAVVDANIIYNDFTPNEKFSASLNPFIITADSIDNKKKLVKVYLKSGIKPYGNLSVSLSTDPSNYKDFDIAYEMRKIPVPIFNPYLIKYTSFPLDRGSVELFGNWQVRNDIIDSKNHLIVIDPRIANRIKKEDSKWIPLRFIMFFVRERGNVIDYEIPITGNLKKPKFNFCDVIIDALQNVFIKPPTTPYRYEVRNTEIVIEKSLSLTWYMRQYELNKEQKKFLGKISDFLKNNPEANIVVHPTTYNDKEKENILFYEAKKKYYFSSREKNQQNITESDSLAIEKMASKDSTFIKYLNKQITDSMLYTVQEKCYRLVGVDLVNSQFEKLLNKRNNEFMKFFKEEKTSSQIKIEANKNEIPFKGFSYFKINYNGDFPQYVIDANNQLNDYNDNAPRDKYKKFRRKKI